MMETLFSSGRVVDLILVLVAIEAAALVWLHRRHGLGPPPARVLGFLLSGAFLMLALRAALTGAWWGWIGTWLAAAGLAHALDLGQRWRS